MAHVEVSAYIHALAEEWQREVCRELCKLVHEAAPRAAESIQEGAPFFDHLGPLCCILAAADTVQLVFVRGAQLPDSPLFFEKGATDGSPQRTIRITEGQMVPAQEVIGLVHAAVKLNKA